jgi:hypothetical protein
MKHTREERRQWPRLPIAIPVFIRGSDARGSEFLDFGTILNISAGGALFASRQHLLRGARVSLEIPVVLAGGTIAKDGKRKFRARVLRTGSRNHFYRYAARFHSPL